MSAIKIDKKIAKYRVQKAGDAAAPSAWRVKPAPTADSTNTKPRTRALPTPMRL